MLLEQSNNEASLPCQQRNSYGNNGKLERSGKLLR